MAYTLKIGSSAPDFKLVDTHNNNYALNDFSEFNLLVIFFTCNHCPFVIGSDEDTRLIVEKYKDKSVGFVAINSNSENVYVDDSFENMKRRMRENNFPWIYLHDKSQKVALDFGALKTPHFFMFGKDRKLLYTGRAVDNPKDSSKIKLRDLERAIDEKLIGKDISVPLTNPIGCNIKWEGRDKRWMPEDACDLI